MLLSVEDLRVGYGPIEALHGITFNVGKGRLLPSSAPTVLESLQP